MTPAREPHPDEVLLEQVADIVRQLAGATDLDDLLQRVADLGERYLDGCDGVSMMLLRRGGEIMSPAYSSVIAYHSDLAQYAADEGPCLEALREHTAIIIDDLVSEERWPVYREAALLLGVRSMASFRLFVHEDTLGALDFYSATPHAFDRRSMALGQVFSSHAAVAMKAAMAEVDMHAALASRDVVGQAKGILMTRHDVTAAVASARLRKASQQRDLPVRVPAEEVIRTGELTTPGDAAPQASGPQPASPWAKPATSPPALARNVRTPPSSASASSLRAHAGLLVGELALTTSG